MKLDFKVLVDILERGREGKGGGKYLGELLEIPFVVFARVVTGEVSGCDIRDCFGVDAYYLRKN